MRDSLIFGLKMGAMLGGTIFLLFITSHLMGVHPLGSLYMLSYLLIFAYVIYSIYYYKRYEMGGDLRFWQGLVIGIVTVGAGVILSSLLIYGYMVLVPNEIVVVQRELLTAQALESKEAFVEGAGQMAFDRLIKDLRQLTAHEIIIDDAVKKIFVGDLIAIIAAVFFRK